MSIIWARHSFGPLAEQNGQDCLSNCDFVAFHFSSQTALGMQSALLFARAKPWAADM